MGSLEEFGDFLKPLGTFYKTIADLLIKLSKAGILGDD